MRVFELLITLFRDRFKTFKAVIKRNSIAEIVEAVIHALLIVRSGCEEYQNLARAGNADSLSGRFHRAVGYDLCRAGKFKMIDIFLVIGWTSCKQNHIILVFGFSL